MTNINLAIFASGSGSNAQNIVNYFADNKHIHVKALLCNNQNAFVLKRLEGSGLQMLVFLKNEFSDSEKIIDFLSNFFRSSSNFFSSFRERKLFLTAVSAILAAVLASPPASVAAEAAATLESVSNLASSVALAASVACM